MGEFIVVEVIGESEGEAKVGAGVAPYGFLRGDVNSLGEDCGDKGESVAGGCKEDFRVGAAEGSFVVAEGMLV